MFLNVSKATANMTTTDGLVKWQCFRDIQEVFSSSDELFSLNVYLFALVNTVVAIFGLLSNFLVIYGAYRNQLLTKVTRTLTVLLAIEGLFVSVIIQPIFITSKVIILVNTSERTKMIYCVVVSIMAYGTMISVAFLIVTMLGVTAERYAAVIYPLHYTRSSRPTFLKSLCLLSGVPSVSFYRWGLLAVVQRFLKTPDCFLHFRSVRFHRLRVR